MTEAEIREVVRSEVREFVRRVVAVVDLTTTLQGTPMAQARAKLREAIEAVGRYDEPSDPKVDTARPKHCGAKDPKQPWLDPRCTLSAGHDGDHVQHLRIGQDSWSTEVWPAEPDPKAG